RPPQTLTLSHYTTLFRSYGIQWAMTFAWFPYFSTLQHPARFAAFLRGFIAGFLVNIIFYLLSGVLEIALYGGLQDAGRLSQNFVDRKSTRLNSSHVKISY